MPRELEAEPSPQPVLAPDSLGLSLETAKPAEEPPRQARLPGQSIQRLILDSVLGGAFVYLFCFLLFL